MLHPRIPRFFVIELKEFENPLTIRIKYMNKEHLEKV